jgi:hypothetical protein
MRVWVFVGVLALLLTGCEQQPSATGSTGATTQSTALCTELLELQAAVSDLDIIVNNPNSTIGQIQNALANVDFAMAEVRTAAQGAAQAEISQLDAAFEGLRTAGASISPDMTLAEASALIQSRVQAVSAARTQLANVQSC